jgi:hypothetical protein
MALQYLMAKTVEWLVLRDMILAADAQRACNRPVEWEEPFLDMLVQASAQHINDQTHILLRSASSTWRELCSEAVCKDLLQGSSLALDGCLVYLHRTQDRETGDRRPISTI